MGRNTQGVTLMKMDEDRVVAVAKYTEEDEIEEIEEKELENSTEKEEK